VTLSAAFQSLPAGRTADLPSRATRVAKAKVAVAVAAKAKVDPRMAIPNPDLAQGPNLGLPDAVGLAAVSGVVLAPGLVRVTAGARAATGGTEDAVEDTAVAATGVVIMAVADALAAAAVAADALAAVGVARVRPLAAVAATTAIEMNLPSPRFWAFSI